MMTFGGADVYNVGQAPLARERRINCTLFEKERALSRSHPSLQACYNRSAHVDKIGQQAPIPHIRVLLKPQCHCSCKSFVGLDQ